MELGKGNYKTKQREMTPHEYVRELTCTIRSISQSVPLPFRKTSSGDMGIIVAREKING